MLLMYSILNWSSGLASGTGGIKVLIADTIVWKSAGCERNKYELNRLNTTLESLKDSCSLISEL